MTALCHRLCVLTASSGGEKSGYGSYGSVTDMREAVDEAGRRPCRGSMSRLGRSPTLLRPLIYQSFDAKRHSIHQILGSVLFRRKDWKTLKVLKIILAR